MKIIIRREVIRKMGANKDNGAKKKSQLCSFLGFPNQTVLPILQGLKFCTRL